MTLEKYVLTVLMDKSESNKKALKSNNLFLIFLFLSGTMLSSSLIASSIKSSIAIL
ncbi:hypothetical protein [Methanosphaera sp.]|uniref:hypothetical protein n=1 Tax=Methanosphaera sp. TaxID=2666342 RepID=UPI0025F8652C|nr:hypothetical protein [Methanosphaera sp.]